MEVRIQLVNVPGSSADWKRALEVPIGELPALTDQQKAFAKDFGMSDEQYARSIWAGLYSEALFRRYAEKLGEFLQAAGLPSEIDVVEISYDGSKNKFHCYLKKNDGQTIPMVIDANIVIHPFETGDEKTLSDAMQRVKRAAEMAISPILQGSRKAG